MFIYLEMKSRRVRCIIYEIKGLAILIKWKYMDTVNRFLPFLLIMTAVLTLVDYYFLKNWTRYVKSRNYNPVYYRAAWVIAVLMLAIAIFVNYYRLVTPQPSKLIIYLFILTSLWYLPKLAIVPFLIIKDLYRSGKWAYYKIKRIFPHKEKAPPKLDGKRRKTLQTLGWSMAGVPFLIAGKGIIHTPYNFRIHEVEIPLKKLPKELDGFTIAQLSDIHTGSFYSPRPVQDAIDIANSYRPQLVMVTGDFVNFDRHEMDDFYKEFAKMKGEFGVYGCLGNHDHYMKGPEHDKLKAGINQSGIKLLVNENRTFDIEGTKIQLAGTDNSGFKQNFADYDRSLAGLDEEYPILLMCHDPTNWDKHIRGVREVDLMLAGHTHGGQIGFELFGKDLTPARIIYRQWAGLYKDKDQYLYINRGLGMTGPPIRIGIEPEVTIIKLRQMSV